MFAKIKTFALAAVVSLGALAAVPASAEASSASFSFGFGHNPSVSFHFGTPGYHHGPGWHHRRACSERQAVDRARHMGLRDVRVVHAGHRAIEVRGRSYRHGRTTVIFARAPHCPVIARY